MSGIVGLFNLDGRPVAPTELKSLAGASAYRAVDGEDFWYGSSAGLGYRHVRITSESFFARQPLVSPSGIAIAFDGRLDNRADLIELWSRTCDGPDGAFSDAALVLAAYERYGEQFAVHLNGDFALALCDAPNRRLVLARDRMGGRALYYCRLPHTVVFASEIKSILAHPAVTSRPDEDALADLVLDGYNDGHRTCFESVHSVLQGHVLVATAGGITTCRHWDFDPAREVRCRSFEDYAEGFKALFTQAVRRRLRSGPPVAISVSGGVDSSAIFCQAAALTATGGAPAPLCGLALTFPGDATADERSYVDEVETASGLPIVRLPVSNLRLPANVEKVSWHMEMPGLMWDAHAQLFARARELGCKSILDGYFGDQVLFDRAYLVDLVRRGRWLKVRHDLRQFATWMTDLDESCFERQLGSSLLRALPPRWLFRAAKKATARTRWMRTQPRWYSVKFLERGLDRSLSRPHLDGRFSTTHAERFYQHATSGFYRVQLQQADAAGLMHGIEVSHPYRDRDLVAFLMAIPGEMVNHEGVPKALLRAALRSKLPEAVRLRRWKADLTGMANQAIAAEYPTMTAPLTRECWSVRAGLVDGGLLEEELAALKQRVRRTDSAVPGWQVGTLLGLELWLRQFFGAVLS